MNDRLVAGIGHPSKLLRYFPLNGRKQPETHHSLAVSEWRKCRNCCRPHLAIVLRLSGQKQSFKVLLYDIRSTEPVTLGLPPNQHSLSMRRISHILVSLILLILIAACSGNPIRYLNTYEGATLSPDQVAKFEYFFFRKKHHKIEIDGKSYTAKSEREMVQFALMPGKHQINFITSHRGVGTFYGECEIHMKAGSTYALFTERYNEGTFLRPEYFARGYILNRTTKEKVYC